VDTAGSPDYDLRAILESLHIVPDAGSANASVALDVHEIANGDNHLLDLLSQLTGGSQNQSLALLDIGIDLLQDRDGESSRLSRAGLGLGDDIVA